MLNIRKIKEKAGAPSLKKNSGKNLLKEAHSVNALVQGEAMNVLDDIVSRLDGKKKQRISFKRDVFGIPVNFECEVYNGKSQTDCYIESENVKEVNHYVEGADTVVLTLFFVNGSPALKAADAIAHELSHVYQQKLKGLTVKDTTSLLQNYTSSSDKYERHLAHLLYFCDEAEQDAVIQGLEIGLANKYFSSDIEEAYNSSYAKDMLDLFDFLLKEYVGEKDSFIPAIKPYRKYGLDYGKILKRAKNAYKRLKLKIGHVLLTHEDEIKKLGRPTMFDLKRLKEEINNNINKTFN